WMIEGAADQHRRWRGSVDRLVDIAWEAGEVGELIGIARVHAVDRTGQGHLMANAAGMKGAAYTGFAGLHGIFTHITETVGSAVAVGIVHGRFGETAGLISLAHAGRHPAGEILIEIILGAQRAERIPGVGEG